MTVTNNVFAAFIVAILANVVGCGSLGIVENAESARLESEQATETVKLETATISIVDRAAFEAVLAKHQGKVILVDFWATWCGPCCEQFPHTIEIDQKYSDEDLAVISVSMDEPDSAQDALDFLQRNGATFEHFISSYGIGQQGFEEFEIGDGAVPFYKIYDREGLLRHSTNDPAEIEIKIKELLIEPKTAANKRAPDALAPGFLQAAGLSFAGLERSVSAIGMVAGLTVRPTASAVGLGNILLL